MDDLIDGTVLSWPASLLIERDAGGSAFGAQIAAYTGSHDEDPPTEVIDACEAITEACAGLKPAAARRKAEALGFAPERNTP